MVIEGLWFDRSILHLERCRWLLQSQVKERGDWREAVGLIYLDLEERLNSSLLPSFSSPYQI